MRRPGGDLDRADRRPATQAGPLRTAIDTVPFLKRARSARRVRIVPKRGAAGVDRRTQRLPNPARQAAYPGVAHVRCPRGRMDARNKQRFVAVDVAEAGNHPLIEKQGLDLPAPATQTPQRRNADGQGIRPGRRQAGGRTVRPGVKPDAAEPPRIADAKVGGAPRKTHANVRVASQRRAARFELRPTAHPEVNDQFSRRPERKDDSLSDAFDAVETAARQSALKRPPAPAHVIRPGNPYRRHHRSDQRTTKLAHDRLNFGQLGHRRIVAIR